ncbi:MAG TPA: potassium transporter TrkG [Rubrobacter sp.]|nr:potassium transporter TrkG [Rubrobacter sp.]
MFGRLSASRLIVYGFIALVAGGTALLKLPWATTDGISLVNAFFVAVSCSTVTGLSTVAIPETFTHFGELVMMVLMQLGGIGIMTVTTLAALLVGQRVGFRRLIAVSEETENAGSPRNTLRLVFQIARITFIVELLGAVALSIGFVQAGLGLGEGVFQGIFHAIMAFCNAGFATLPGDDLISYAGNWLIVVALVCVITLGGLGFPVLVDLYHYRQSPRLSVHSRVVLITSSALVVFGVLSVAVMEWTNPHTLGGESMSTKAAMSLFQGVTPRTAGFQTVSYPEMREPTLLVQTVLMFIGTAPTSTGGGIKVTTLALVVLIVAAQVRGQERITLFWRTLPRPLISRALSVLAVASLLVLLSTLALMVSDGLELLPALFEVTSAFGTVGLSLDVTPHLSTFGKILISVLMFLGRVGPITFIVALAARQRTPHYRYPEEEIAIG